MNYLDYQFDALFELLFSIQGLVLLLIYAACCILAISSPKLRWIALALLLWSTTLSKPTYLDMVARTLAFPLETLRLHARSISSAVAIALVLPAITRPRRWRTTLVPLGLFAYLLFQLTFSSLELVHNVSAKTILAVILFILTFLAMVVGLGKELQDDRDVSTAICVIAAAAAMFAAATTYQLVIDSSAAIRGGRLLGTTGNAQFAATIIATAILPCLYLLLDRQQPKVLRFWMAMLIGLLIVFLVWTGSRTGALMAVVGCLAFFRLRLGRLIFAGLAVSAFVLLAMQFFSESTELADRVISGTDTRTHVWRRQWELFMQNPVSGTIADEGGIEVGGGENSYLTVAASYGLIGISSMLLMLALMVRDTIRTLKLRHWVPEHKMLIDLVLAGFASAAAGAFFEVFLLGQFNFIVLTVFIYSAFAAYVRDLAGYRMRESALLDYGHFDTGNLEMVR